MRTSETFQRNSISAYKTGRLTINFQGLDQDGKIVEIKAADIARMCEMPFEDLMKRLRREFRLIKREFRLIKRELGNDDIVMNIYAIMCEAAARARRARYDAARTKEMKLARRRRARGSDSGRTEAERTLMRVTTRRNFREKQ